MNQFARPGLAVTELPPVNADDNGKVLGVSDGAWTKVAASGGPDLPDDPAQDGTYNLQNTVSSGTGTLSWASGSSGGGALKVGVTETESGNETTYTLDKTWKQISDTVNGGGVAYTMPITDFGDNNMEAYIDVLTYWSSSSDNGYVVKFGKGPNYTAAEENGYPSYTG